MKALPLSVQSFYKMRQGNYLYVDKTEYMLPLIIRGGYYFFARPRRFGKSLLVSTLKEIFAGKQELFKGLFIYDKITWDSHPVIHLDLTNISFHEADIFRQSLSSWLDDVAEEYDIPLTKPFLKDKFAELLRKIFKTTGKQAVVLIDEYDKPIIEYVNDPERASKNKEILRQFYGILKPADEYLRFVLLTGVSKFSRVSIFSDLNNLEDMTLAPQWTTVLGYTRQELERDFDEYLQQFCKTHNLSKPQLLKKIQMWYNGYSWNAKDKVYNPVSILNLFDQQRFGNYWFETGTPTFLINLIKQTKIDTTEFEHKRVSELIFNSYDIENMDMFALLFQTGYLTITDIQEKQHVLEYTLTYPNMEVKEAFLSYLINSFTNNRLGEIQITAQELRTCLQEENLEKFMNIIRALFAKIPYQLHIEEEAYYHSLFYMILALMGVEIDLEVLTDKGRIDGVLECDDTIYVIEFKYGKSGSKPDKLTEKALKQIHKKKYDERFLNDSRQRLLLGVGFAGKEIAYRIEHA